jgi:3-oxoacyl-[acyl-carrier protein] reductase
MGCSDHLSASELRQATEGKTSDGLGIKGRRAIVTGGGSGIGFETVRQFLEEGVRVLIAGRTVEKINKARDELARRTGGEVYAVQADMSKEPDIKRLVDTAREKLGGVDILVNNAGTMYSGRFASIKDDELKNQIETKLFGFMRAIRLVYPMMKAQKWGRIVNTIGGAGKEPDPYMFGSAMTNSALLNLTKSLSEEFGEDNVLVNAICPGWVATDLWVRNADGLKKELNVKSEEEARKLAARKNSLGRMGKPEELANATVFLCSERASYITGVSLNLDGGRLAFGLSAEPRLILKARALREINTAKAHPSLTSSTCGSPPIATLVMRSASSSTNRSSIVIRNGSCVNRSRFRTKTLHCPMRQIAAQRAARSCVFGGRNRRTISTAAERYEVVLVAMNFRKTFDGCALSHANIRM